MQNWNLKNLLDKLRSNERKAARAFAITYKDALKVLNEELQKYVFRVLF